MRFEGGEIVKTVNQLVRPPDNYYSYHNIRVHGITPEDTYNAPTFEEVWGQIKPFIEDEILVAHNASFDCGCLKKTLEFYDLAEVKFRKECTYKIYKKYFFLTRIFYNYYYYLLYFYFLCILYLYLH